MKSMIPQILIVASLIAALVLGFPLLRFLCLHLYAAPGMHTLVRATRISFVRSLLVPLSPLALYAVSFALDSQAVWSRLGKVGFFVQVCLRIVAYGSLDLRPSSCTPPHCLTTRSSERRLAVAFFLELHLLRRQPPSLSLGPLGPESLAWGSSMESLFPFAVVEPVPVPLPARRSFQHASSSVHPFPAAAPVIPPPESPSLLRAVRSVGAGLTTRSSEQRLAAGSFLHSTSCVASLCR